MIYPEVKALDGSPKKLIVFLHGVGSDGDDLISLAPFMQKDLPDSHFISPHGVESYDMATYGRQWFSLQNRSDHTLAGLMATSTVKIAKIIKDKQIELNLTNSSTILIGFSQGAMLGLYMNLTSIEPFGAIISFSGALIAPSLCVNKITNICLIHGEEDDVIDIDVMYKASLFLKNQNINHEIFAISNLKHSINDEGTRLAINFINKVSK